MKEVLSNGVLEYDESIRPILERLGAENSYNAPSNEPYKATPTPRKRCRVRVSNSGDKTEPAKDQQICAHISQELHKQLKIFCLSHGTNITQHVKQLCISSIHSAYRCRNPQCQCEFVITDGLEENQRAVASCPCCGTFDPEKC